MSSDDMRIDLKIYWVLLQRTDRFACTSKTQETLGWTGARLPDGYACSLWFCGTVCVPLNPPTTCGSLNHILARKLAFKFVLFRASAPKRHGVIILRLLQNFKQRSRGSVLGSTARDALMSCLFGPGMARLVISSSSFSSTVKSEEVITNKLCFV
jgi:hypothetical protein